MCSPTPNQQRLDRGWSTLAFVKARLIRLYPLYALGLGLGFAYVLVQQSHGASTIPRASPVAAAPAGRLYAAGDSRRPARAGRGSFPTIFPPGRSFNELLINIVHALFLRRRSLKYLIALLTFSGVGSAAYSLHAGTTDYGVSPHDIPGALLRITFAYTAGLLIFRLWNVGRRVKPLPPWLLTALLLAALAVPAMGPATVYVELLLIAVVFPLAARVSRLGAALAPRGRGCTGSWGCCPTRSICCRCRSCGSSIAC